MNEEFKTALDLRDFIAKQSNEIADYIEKSHSSFDDLSKDTNWIAEQILLLIVKWSTGITTSVIKQDVIKKAGYIKKNSSIKPEQAFITPTIHGTVSAINHYSDNGVETGAYSLILSQRNGEHTLNYSVHGALVPFVENHFIRVGTKIHIANARFSNDIIIPTQLLIVDLNKTREEISFIMNSVSNWSLSKIDLRSPIPHALLLRVLDATTYGVSVSDGSTEIPFQIHLGEERNALKLLLRFNDVIVMYRPDVIQVTQGRFELYFGPNTVIFRVPAKGETIMSQLTQRGTTLSQDGLLFRNSTACRSVCGHVIEIHHQIQSDQWTTSSIHIITPENRTVTIHAYINQMPTELQGTLALVRTNHYIWAFGMLYQEGNYTFTPEATLFDTSLMHGIVSSDIVPIMPLKIINKFSTFLCRAVIIKVSCEVKQMHTICRTLLNESNECSYCNHTVTSQRRAILVARLQIDDGTSEPIEVVTTNDKLPFWGVTVKAFTVATPTKQREMQNALVGQEFIFTLSVANEKEFGTYDDSPGWRADIVSQPVGDVQRHIKQLIDWHKENE